MDEKTIKNNISRRRRMLSISQTEMAELLDIDRNTYRNIESGKTRILNCHLEAIAGILRISVEELLGFSPDAVREKALLQDAQAAYGSKVEALTKEYEDRIAESAATITALKKRISELEETVRDKCEIISFLREKSQSRTESPEK